MNNLNEKVAIIIPIYNAEKYVKRCIESVISQTYPYLEIILVNDGSTDNSGQICELYKKDDRIKIFYKENGGLVSAWMYGLEQVSDDCNFIVFIDGDDWIEKNHIYKMILEQTVAGVDMVIVKMKQVCSTTEYILPFLIEPKRYYKEELIEDVYPIMLHYNGFEKRGIPVSRCGKLIKKEFLLKNLKYSFLNATYEEDLNIIFPILLDLSSISLLNDEDAAYCYRMNHTSMLHSYDSNMYNSITNIYPRLQKACKDKNKLQFYTQLNAEYVSAVIRCCTNELQNPKGFNVAKKNIAQLINKSNFKYLTKTIKPVNYPCKFKIVYYILSNYNWFNKNILLLLLFIAKKLKF